MIVAPSPIPTMLSEQSGAASGLRLLSVGHVRTGRTPGANAATGRISFGTTPLAFAENDDKERVLQAADIVRLVGEHVALKRKGREYVGLCPFHDDHSPSMFVVPHKRIYHCFSCGAGGNVFTFVMDYYRMGFREALQFLADRFGVKLTPRKIIAEPTDGPSVSKEQLLAASAMAADFFRVILRHPQHGAAARALAERRGITAETIERFGIGAAPDRWDGLRLTAERKGLSADVLLGAGLVKRSQEGGQPYDTFRDRLMFPICDQLGRVIAFGGRRLRDKDDQGNEVRDAKYLNSPENPLFNKSATLYGLHLAGQSIRSSGIAVVTEGYMDCVACHQAGITNVVATLGTALTPQHARILGRLCETVVLLFDGDEAGQRAADRAIEVFFASPMEVKIATLASAQDPNRAPGLPAAKDPDELLKQPGGLERLTALLNSGGVDALTFRFDRLVKQAEGMTMSARAALVDDEMARLAQLGLSRVSPVRRAMIVRRIAALAGVDEATVRTALAAQPPVPAPTTPGGQDGESRTAGTSGPRSGAARSAEELLVAAVLTDDTLLTAIPADQRSLLAPASLPDGPARRLAEAVFPAAGPADGFIAARALSSLEDPELQRLAASMVADVEHITGGNPQNLRRAFDDALLVVKRRNADRALPAGNDQATVLARIAARQSMHASVGKDPRSIPKPG